MSATSPQRPAGVRAQVVEAILAAAAAAVRADRGFTAEERALLDAATGPELAAATGVLRAEHAAALAVVVALLRARVTDLDDQAAFLDARIAARYRRWRSEHRGWDRTRPWAPAPKSGP